MKPPFPTREEFINAYIRLQNAEDDTPDYKESFWSHMHMFDLCMEQPQVVLELVRDILAQNSSTRMLQNLSAGPLEQILVDHGSEVIDEIEKEADRSPLFRKLMGGVWRSDMKEDIWQRVQARWDRRGWDGNPE